MLLGFIGVSKVFDGRRGKVVALEGINLNIRGGEFVCLVGASGCGKTSLLTASARDPPRRPGPRMATEEKKSCFLEYSLMDLQGNTSAPRNIGMFRGAA